jgi:lysophospholipase L1-like esterase
VYGYSSLQGLRYYRTYLRPFDPDIVTIMFGWNDHGILRGMEGREFRNPVLAGVANTASQLATYRSLAGLTTLMLLPSDPAQAKYPPYRPRVTLEDFGYNLEELVRLVSARGAHPLLITEPCGPLSAPYRKGEVAGTWALNGLKDYDTLERLHADYNQEVRAVAKRLGVVLVDAEAEFRALDKSQLFDPYDIVHPNERGHKLIAELIFRRMWSEGWVRTPGPPSTAVNITQGTDR